MSPKKELLRDRWIRGVLAFHKPILWVALVATIVSGWLSTKLVVDTDLRRLLPDGHPVLLGLDSIETTFGSTGSVNVVIKDGTPELRAAFTSALGEELEGHPLLREVDDRLPSDFFTEHALYYLSDAEMTELKARVEAYSHYELCSRASDVCLLPPDPRAPDALEGFIQRKREEALARTGFKDRYERAGIEASVVLLHPIQAAASLEFSREISAQMRAAVAAVFDRPDASWAGSSLSYNIVGPYTTKADEHATIRKDMIRSGIIGAIGVVAIIYLLFRSSRAVLVLLAPLACGVVWSFAITQLVLGRLNLMTSLISTVLMGMGIDAGIHFYTRAKADRRNHDDAEAIRRAFHSLIIPLAIASGTTIGAFLVMATSEFPAFREFGMISAWGVGLCMLAMCTVLPALMYMIGIKRHEPKPAHRQGAMMHALLTKPGVMFVAIVAMTVLSFQGARHVAFEYNGRALQSDRARQNSQGDTALISEIFGKDIHAGILVQPDYASTQVALEQARRRHEARQAVGNTVVASLFAAPDLMPPPSVDIKARRRAIEQLYAENEDTFIRLEDLAAGRKHVPRVRTPKTSEDRDDFGGSDDWDEDPEEDASAPPKRGRATPGQGAAKGGGETAEAEGPAHGATTSAVVGDTAKAEPGSPMPNAGGEGAGTAELRASGAKTDGEPGTGAQPPNGSDAKPPNGGDVKTPSDQEGDKKRMSSEEAKALVEMFAAQPFGIDDLPQVLLRKVRGSDGSYGVFAYPDFDAADMRKGVEFTDETSTYVADVDSVFVGETTAYAAMFLMLREEAPVVVGMAAVLIAAFVYWQLRSLPLTLLALLPLGLALWWMVGLMGAIGLKFTLFNLPILPAILGIGVDNGVYLADTVRRTHGEVDALSRALQETGGAIVAATSTTVAGFAAFLVADSGGLRGIGGLASIGITLAAVSALLVLPTLWALGQRRRGRRSAIK